MKVPQTGFELTTYRTEAEGLPTQPRCCADFDIMECASCVNDPIIILRCSYSPCVGNLHDCSGSRLWWSGTYCD